MNKVIKLVSKISVREYFDRYPDGLLYAEGYKGGNEGFFDFPNLFCILEYNQEIPTSFQATKPINLEMDMDTILLQCCEKLTNEDDGCKMFDLICGEDIVALQNLVDMWLKYAGPTHWEIDKRVVVIPDERDKELYF